MNCENQLFKRLKIAYFSLVNVTILHFQNVTADDNNQDAFFSVEVNIGNSTENFDYEDYEYHTTNDTNPDMEKQVNATLFPTVSFFLLLTSLLIHGTLMLFHFTFFQNVTADDDNQDLMLSHENDTYIEQDDTDMEKQINATLLFPTVRFIIIDVSFDSWHVNVIPFYVFSECYRGWR